MSCISYDDSNCRVPCSEAAAHALREEEPQQELHPLEKKALQLSASPAELADVEAKWRLMESETRLELLDPRPPPLLPEQLKDIAGKSPNLCIH